MKYKTSITKKQSILTKEDRMVHAVLLFVFQYSLTMPLTIFLPASVLMAITTMLLALYALATKLFDISSKTLLLFFIPLLLLILKLPFEYNLGNDGDEVGAQFLIGFITSGLSGILFGTIPFSMPKFLSLGYKFAWLNFIVIGILPFIPAYSNQSDIFDYMRFGYALLPTVFFSYISIFKGKTSITHWILFILSLISLVVFGARGAFLSFILFFLITFFLLRNVSISSKIIMLISIVIGVISMPYLLSSLVTILDNYGIFSYSVSKYYDALYNNDFISTVSGRDSLYDYAINRISNFSVFGDPLNSCYLDSGGDFYYYHNIFLDLLVNFGLVITLIFVLFVLYLACRIFIRGSIDEILVFMLLSTIPLVRLMVSSSLWLRPDFWLFLSFSLSLLDRFYTTRIPNNKNYK